MDPLRFAIAVVPLAAYLAVLGMIHLRPRPLVVSGACDSTALGLGLVGLVFIGPLELFRPEMATGQFLNYIWFALLALYLLWVLLAALVSRPRLVIYNLTAEELRPLLSEAASNADPTFRWAGDSLALPRLGVQLHLDSFGLLRNTSLISSGPRQSFEGWHKLSKQLRAAMRSTRVGPTRPAILMLATAVLLLWGVEYRLLADLRPPSGGQQLAQALDQLLGFGWQRN